MLRVRRRSFPTRVDSGVLDYCDHVRGSDLLNKMAPVPRLHSRHSAEVIAIQRIESVVLQRLSSGMVDGAFSNPWTRPVKTRTSSVLLLVWIALLPSHPR